MPEDRKTLFEARDSQPSAHLRRLTTIDTHIRGEPLRIVTWGLPRLPGRTVLEKRYHFMEHHDDLPRGPLREPRGHADIRRRGDEPSRWRSGKAVVRRLAARPDRG